MASYTIVWSSVQYQPSRVLKHVSTILFRRTVLLRNNLTETRTRPERVPKCVPFAFHMRSIRVSIAFHLCSTFTGTHLQNAFRLHSYRNWTLLEIIEISRVLVSVTFTFCVHTITHQTAFLYAFQ